MKDRFNREINYLRLSVTQRCLQRCVYCSKSDGGCPKEKELSAQSLIKIADACARLGMTKIRLTGGEPLLRKDFEEIAYGISSLGKYSDIAITTNAQLLGEKAHMLKKAGVMRCNISIDSLIPDTYKEITGGELQRVFEGIEAAFREGLTPIRLNTVLIKGKNDREIDSFIDIAREYPIDVRFIELMPMGDNRLDGVFAEDILSSRPYLIPDKSNKSEPAVYYTAEGFRGRVGIISSISACFCKSCNRIRITSDGFIRPCLGNGTEYSLTDYLNGDTERLANRISEAILCKPEKNSFSDSFSTERKMNAIGG